MFFLLSKLLDFVFSPVFWLALLLGWALFTRRPRWRYRLLLISLVLALASTNAPLVDKALRAWELPPRHLQALPAHDAGILLTGLGDGRKKPPKPLRTDGPAPSRLAGALWLYQAGRIRHIIISGGSGELTDSDQTSEARHLAGLLRAAGVPPSAILLEERSRNTRENAVYSRQLLARHPNIHSLVLITSAYHQRRAQGCFQQVGLHPTPFPTDFRAQPYSSSWRYLLVPQVGALERWELLLHEIAGYLMYQVLGYC